MVRVPIQLWGCSDWEHWHMLCSAGSEARPASPGMVRLYLVVLLVPG